MACVEKKNTFSPRTQTVRLTFPVWFGLQGAPADTERSYFLYERERRCKNLQTLCRALLVVVVVVRLLLEKISLLQNGLDESL